LSWDVILVGAPARVRSTADFPKDYDPPRFERATAIARITELFPNAVDFSNPSWGVIDGDGWSMEVNIGKEETTQSFMLHVRGGGDPLPAIFQIADALGLRPLDCSSGELLSPDNPEAACFKDWQAYRDQVMGREQTPTLLERVGRWFGARKAP
jgi:hypothetical protein